MAAHQRTLVLRWVRTLTCAQADAQASDSDLLRRFTAARDEASFETLLSRHGPMVLCVARRVLPDWNDAEDVFQATFLAFARRAGSIRSGASVSSWLHGVAYRLALKVKVAARRRQQREVQALVQADSDPLAALTARELVSLMDEEVQRLPEKYRVPLLLCYWEGRTHNEAARQLACPLGTLRSRLERARELLRGRLMRCGVTLSVALCARLAEGEAAAVLPVALRVATVRAAALSATDSVVAVAVSARVTALALEATKVVFQTRFKIMAALVLATLAVAGAGAMLLPPSAESPKALAAAKIADKQEPIKGNPRNDLHGDPLPAGVLVRMGTVRLRHAGDVRWAAFCPNGKTVITGSYDGTMRQWNLTDGKEVRRFGTGLSGPPDFDLRIAALSPDGKLLAASGEARSGVSIWDVAAGNGPRSRLSTKGANCLAWSPDNRMLAAGGKDGLLRLWDARHGRELRSVALHNKQIDCVVFSPDGKRLATAGRDGALHLIDVAGKETVRTLRAREKEYHFVAFSRDGKELISAGDCYGDNISSKVPWVNTVAVWDAATGKRRRDFRVGDDQDGGNEGAPSVALAPDGKTLAFGYWDHTIRLWDLASGKPLRKLTEFPDRFYPAYHVAFSLDGRTLAAAGHHSAVCLLDVATGRRLLKGGIAQECDIRSVALSADGRLVATGSPDQTIVLWDAATGKPRREFRGHDGWVYSVALTPDARTIVSGGSDGTVRIWDTASGKEVRKMTVRLTLPKPFRGTLKVQKVAVSPNGKLVASSHLQAGMPGRVLNGPDGIRLWEAATGKELRMLEGSPAELCFLSFSADGKVLIAATERATIRLWEVATGKEIRRCSPLGGTEVYDAAVTADARFAALSDWNGRVTVVEVSTGQTLLDVRGPAKTFYKLAFTANGQFLSLACSAQGNAQGRSIELWEMTSGKRVYRHAVPAANGVVSAALSADGRTLVTGMLDTTALVWNLVPDVVMGAPRRAEDSWAALAGDDATRAYQAQLALSAMSDEALPLLRHNLRPAAEVNRKRLLGLIADLGGDTFVVRERAAKALEEFGPEARPVITGVLSGTPSAEVRRRLKAWQGIAPLPVRSGDELRSLRAISVLERIGTQKARRLLETLAKGGSAARRTNEAKAALERLGRRTAKRPD